MDVTTEARIAALQRNVALCREMADLTLASAERLEQVAHRLEREAWRVRLRDAAARPDDDAAALAAAEQQVLAAMTEVCAGWLQLMRAYSANAGAAAVGPAASSCRAPLAALGSFWSEAEERFRALFPPPGSPPRSIAASAPHRAAEARPQ